MPPFVAGSPGKPGAASWAGNTGIITTNASRPARTGSYKAWFGGNATTSTETLCFALLGQEPLSKLQPLLEFVHAVGQLVKLLSLRIELSAVDTRNRILPAV